MKNLSANKHSYPPKEVNIKFKKKKEPMRQVSGMSQKKPRTRSNPKVLVTIVTGVAPEEILSPCGHFPQQKL